MRDVYLISDLHLGGAQPSTDDPNDRGFRICTHGRDLARFVSALAARPPAIELIVNGDMVDFLTEEDEGGGWTAFTLDEHAATRKLDRIIDRDRELFDALGVLLQRGHRLTLLLGNHDVELALPAVRRRLAERIAITGQHDFHFIYDGEAYVVGRALIEHGNRYDPFNVVDYDSLRRVRSLLSRNQPLPPSYVFEAPAGSHIVTDIINPIKTDYRLIDLLKPETRATIPLLMALEPGYRNFLRRAVALSLKARRHRLAAAALPSSPGDIRSETDDIWAPDSLASGISSSGAAHDPLVAILRDTMKGEADLVLSAAAVEPSFAGDISARETVDRTLGLARMLVSSSREAFESRLPALLAAVRSLQTDTTFARDAECPTQYLDAARDLASNGFECVIFGHTHLARDIAMPRGARYLNSGTWADLIRFPSEILAGSDRQALDGLRAFVEDMGQGRLLAWISFIPTYVKLSLDESGRVRDAVLCDYTSTADL